MEKTWKGTWAGILTIIGGCFGIGVGAFVASELRLPAHLQEWECLESSVLR